MQYYLAQVPGYVESRHHSEAHAVAAAKRYEQTWGVDAYVTWIHVEHGIRTTRGIYPRKTEKHTS